MLTKKLQTYHYTLHRVQILPGCIQFASCSKSQLELHGSIYHTLALKCLFYRFREFVSLPLEQRRFCVDCQLLILPGEWQSHEKHKRLSEDITVQRLRRPSLLLCPLENKKSNAQYLFADRSCHFLLDMLAGLGFQKILSVGTPRWVWMLLLKMKNFTWDCYC